MHEGAEAKRSGLELLERLGRLAPVSYLDLCCYPRRAKILLFLRLSAGFFLVVVPDGIRHLFDFRLPKAFTSKKLQIRESVYTIVRRPCIPLAYILRLPPSPV